jgi:hypothetical protein
VARAGLESCVVADCGISGTEPSSCATLELRNYEHGSWENSYVLRMVNEWNWLTIMSSDRFRQ